jgi:hypothetical protein
MPRLAYGSPGVGHLSYLAFGAPLSASACRLRRLLIVDPAYGGLAVPKGEVKARGRQVEDSKRLLLEQLAQGQTVARALDVIGRSRPTYESWRRTDRDFARDVDRLRLDMAEAMKVEAEDSRNISFADFSEKFLDARVFPHAQNVIDMIEGREPSWLHPGMTWETGEPDLCIVNMPPEHAKSTTVTMNYVTYRIAMDPNIRVMVVSKTMAMARKFLYGIKTRLTHPKYALLQTRYGPPGGYDSDSASWTQDMIYVSGASRDSGEKDPTVQALGVRGHIYGARADLIILDDVVDGTNAHEYDKQIDWIQSEVVSRLSPSGSLLVVGTRLASKDLYLELRNPARYPEETSPWSYLAMPAVLTFADKADDWETLWPKSNLPEIGARGEDMDPDAEGLFPKWNGERLFKKRARMTPRTWSMVYMQAQVADDAIFDPQSVAAAVNGNRMTGLMPKGMQNCRPNGDEGLIIVAGLDPATTGHTAAIVGGLDPQTQKRYVFDVFNKPGVKPDEIRELIMSWSDKYRIAEWRIEKNGFQGFLVHDREVNDYCAARGTVIRPHFTGSNKHDADFGVASMTVLFQNWQEKRQLIELPSTSFSEAAKALVEQLVTWSPDLGKKAKTDLVMALWFFELACRDRVVSLQNFTRHHAMSMFHTPWDKSQQSVINLLDMEAQGSWQPTYR